ncbi:jg24404, partial [Pararge aegeria aegeria]
PVAEEPVKVQQDFKNVQKVEIKPQTKMKMQADKKIIIESKTQVGMLD